MSRAPEMRRPAPKTRPLNAPPAQSQQKLPLTDFIHRQLVTLADRDRQRSRLVNVLIGALALFVIGTAPGYIGFDSTDLPVVLLGTVLLGFSFAFAPHSLSPR